MGCASSKIEASVDAYRPAPASFAVFDINAIEEPWVKLNTTPLVREHVPSPILHMLEATEAPQSWAELSKALEDLKPTLTTVNPPPRKSMSFHTVEELDAKLNSKPTVEELDPKFNSKSTVEELDGKFNSKPTVKELDGKFNSKPIVDDRGSSAVEPAGFKPLKDNLFIVRDRLEREKLEGKQYGVKREALPLSEYPEKCPPGGKEAMVIYTTSLGGVRKTFEECNRVREVLEGHRVVYDERDVSLHAEFLKELKELVGEGVKVPRVFLKGRYVGGVEELVQLNESGRLGRILNSARVERGIGRQACGGCGGARFVPCLECGGSCKVVSGDIKHRCPNCNENGLVHCPACL